MKPQPSPLESVPAATSEFFRAELAAFVAMARRTRPLGWAHVQELQRACVAERLRAERAARQPRSLEPA